MGLYFYIWMLKNVVKGKFLFFIFLVYKIVKYPENFIIKNNIFIEFILKFQIFFNLFNWYGIMKHTHDRFKSYLTDICMNMNEKAPNQNDRYIREAKSNILNLKEQN